MIYTSTIRRVGAYIVSLCLLTLGAAGCGGGGGGGPKPAAAGLTVGVSDTTPACSGLYQHVYVTISDVDVAQTASSSGSVTGGSSAAGSATALNGGLSLTPGLSSAPKQVDLFAPVSASNQCLAQVLTTSGSVPAGTYRSMFVVLLGNGTPAPGVTPPSVNACASLGSNVFNCVQTANGVFEPLVLPTDAALTGIFLSQNQISNGGLVLQQANNPTIDVDFDSCQSLVAQSNGQLSFKPAVRTGLVGSNPTVSGQIVRASLNGSVVSPTTAGVSGAQVWLEQQSRGVTVSGATGAESRAQVENVVQATVTDANGNFSFCPVAQGSYEIVADAAPVGVGTFPSFPSVTTGVTIESTSSSATSSPSAAASPTARATATSTSAAEQVAPVIDQGAVTGLIIPLVPQTAAPAVIAGLVSGTANNQGVPLDVRLAATQQSTLTLAGTTTSGQVQVVIPPLPPATSPPVLVITTSAGGTNSPSCQTFNLSCTTGTDCACYLVSLPSGEVILGSMTTSGNGYVPQGSVPASYSIDAQAYTAGASTPLCSPSELITAPFSVSQPVNTAPNILFTACSRVLPSPSPSASASPTASASTTPHPTASASAMASVTPSAGISPTAAVSPSPGVTPTAGATPIGTVTATP